MKLDCKFLLSFVALLFFVPTTTALVNLEGDSNFKKSAVSGGKHLDIYDTNTNRQCYDINYNKGNADFLLNPYLASNNRGNWGEIYPTKIEYIIIIAQNNIVYLLGKCIPELLFQTQW